MANTCGAVAFVYALSAAWRRRSTGTAIGGVLSVGLKFWWLNLLVRRYDARTGTVTD